MNDLRDFYEKEAETVRRYDSLSFWDSRYHKKRKNRIVTILKSCATGIFLDVGCGTGEYLVEASRFNAETIGVDLSKTYLKNVKKLHSKPQLIQADARALPLKNKSINCVLCSETLEHLPDPTALIKEISRVANRTIVVSTPNPGIMRLALAKISENSLKLLDEKVGHISILPFHTLKTELTKNNCTIKSAEVLHILPPIIGELSHLPRKMAGLIDILEVLAQLLFPSIGNISLIVCEPY
jgi:ubiquinone/menaquinone biosynthesis C-methylase UbiE